MKSNHMPVILHVPNHHSNTKGPEAFSASATPPLCWGWLLPGGSGSTSQHSVLLGRGLRHLRTGYVLVKPLKTSTWLLSSELSVHAVGYLETYSIGQEHTMNALLVWLAVQWLVSAHMPQPYVVLPYASLRRPFSLRAAMFVACC